MKKIAILGSTGSIGTQALDVIARDPESFRVSALSCAGSVDKLRAQIERFHPELVSVEKESDALQLRRDYPTLDVEFGPEGLVAIAESQYDMLLNSLSGMRGLEPTYRAAKRGRRIALANKETLVAGGAIVMAAAAENGAEIIPVDSEHSAIFQCLKGGEKREVRSLILTASGGPFRGYTYEQLKEVTAAQALKHPNWSMGKKVTIDSASMMNKGLEIIEAAWLFDMPEDRIEVVIHPQSMVHSMVRFTDGIVLAQLGKADMRLPISYALTYPSRCDKNGTVFFDIIREAGNLTFEKADEKTFRTMKLARQAFREGGSSPVAMNAANEVLVQLFLDGKIGFTDIQDNVEKMLCAMGKKPVPTLEDILAADAETRAMTLEAAGQKA